MREQGIVLDLVLVTGDCQIRQSQRQLREPSPTLL
jgi:hypothetical protein